MKNEEKHEVLQEIPFHQNQVWWSPLAVLSLFFLDIISQPLTLTLTLTK